MEAADLSPEDQSTTGNQDYDNRSIPAETYFEHFYLDKQIKEAIMKGVDQNVNYADSTTHYLADQHDDK